MEKLIDLYGDIIAVTLNHTRTRKYRTSIFFPLYLNLMFLRYLFYCFIFNYVLEFAILMWHHQNCTRVKRMCDIKSCETF